MKATKLLKGLVPIGGIAVIAGAAVIITSLMSNSKGEISIHSLSEKEAISMGLENMFSDAADYYSADSKTETGITITINELHYLTSWADSKLAFNIKNNGQNYEAFLDGLTTSIKDSTDVAVTNMTVTNLGLQPFSDAEYYCYEGDIAVEDLADIVKAGLIYSLKNEDFQSLADNIYADTTEDNDDLYYDYNIYPSEQMSSIAMILEAYWPMIVSEIKNTLGSTISFTVYLTEDVEIVGYQLYLFDVVTINADYTGSTENHTPFSYYNVICYEQDTTFADISLSISNSPIEDDNEISADQLTDLINTLKNYLESYNIYGALFY